ncbi:MAG: sulfotransferase [bacterium]|nr:sulfotransferase [bacterium]
MKQSADIRLPMLIRSANWLNAQGNRIGLPMINLSEASLMASARKATGLDDFGDEDFLTPMRILLRAYEEEAALSFLGRTILRTETVQALSNRLLVQEELKRHPEILDVPVTRPIFIVSFPRTGTTMLHNLFVQHPQTRVPRTWELRRPAPAPDPATDHSDVRIDLTRKELAYLFRLIPVFRALHPMTATGADECFYLFQNAFASPVLSVQAHVPNYLAWFMQADFVPIYRYYRTMLQLMQWKYPGTYWVLKCPFHLFALDALLEVFPDACVIQTHRDPWKVIASSCSVYEVTRLMFTESPDPIAIGKQWLTEWGTAIQRMLQVRARANPDRFYDVHYRDLVADPIKTMKEIHAHFDLSFDDATV